MLKKFLWICLFVICLFGNGHSAQASGLMEVKEEYVIVIDPGHGGDNVGTTSNPNFEEKEITMKTALALVEELSKYEGVKVYLTHEKDVDLSLKDRAVFAEKKDADFLFSIHYNASENHTMFGTEVWIPLEAPFHALCYEFAYLQQLEMQELGLFSRGIKTRQNEKGTDYYGIIRESISRDIPAVIIEHCYIDEARDASYVDSDEDFAEFGRRDAIAIAKFLGLQAYDEIPELNSLEQDTLIAHTFEDKTSPKSVMIETDRVDYQNNLLTVTVSAQEGNTPLLYYDYSIDGGTTFSKLYPWPGSDMLKNVYDDYFALTFDIPENTKPEVVLRAYNKFDLDTESNLLSGFETFQSVIEINPTPPDNVENKESIESSKPVSAKQDMMQETSSVQTKRLLLLAAFIFLWILLFISVVYMIYSFFGNGKRNHK